MRLHCGRSAHLPIVPFLRVRTRTVVPLYCVDEVTDTGRTSAAECLTKARHAPCEPQLCRIRPDTSGDTGCDFNRIAKCTLDLRTITWPARLTFVAWCLLM